MLERGSLINDMWAPFALPIAADIDTRTQWFNEVLLVIGYDHAMQSIAVTDGNFGAQVLVLQVACIVAIFMEVVLLIKAVPFPVLHSEMLRQKFPMQCQIEKKLSAVGRDFVEDLLLWWLVGQGPCIAP